MSQPQILEFPSEGAGLPPLIPEGEYQLRLQGHRTAYQFGNPKLILQFTVLDFGRYHGTMLPAFYNVAALKGKPGKSGKCKHKHTGHFMIEYFTLFPERGRVRLDRVPMEPLYEAILVGKVRTVKRNNEKVDLPEQLRHSIVDKLLRAEN